MASVSEDSAQFFAGEGSDRFPWSDVFQEDKTFFKRKLQDRFPSAVRLSPLREPRVVRLSSRVGLIADSWTEFARTFTQFSIYRTMYSRHKLIGRPMLGSVPTLSPISDDWV